MGSSVPTFPSLSVVDDPEGVEVPGTVCVP